jgi:hypothetical protein
LHFAYIYKRTIADQIFPSNPFGGKPIKNSLTNLTSMEKAIIFKFIHDRLPTKSRDNKFYSYCTKHCNSCQGENEDKDHILRCHSVKQFKYRNDWMNALQEYLSLGHTPLAVKTCILSNLQKWLEPPYINELSMDTVPSSISKAMVLQYDIG